ncbi:hypothetical protein C0J52_14185 [Blattella germanica]|nr:hypothetical protein C0J52_14185 [Blattella germanica]
MSKLQSQLANEFLCVSVDENADVEGREPYLLNCCQLDRANSISVTQLVIDSMKLAWSSGIKYDHYSLNFSHSCFTSHFRNN